VSGIHKDNRELTRGRVIQVQKTPFKANQLDQIRSDSKLFNAEKLRDEQAEMSKPT